MESKQITLRSQTTRCPHCGEQYSVTYKYCPFCDVGRKEEERRQAEKKKQRQAKIGGILGSEPEKKKKKRPEDQRRQERPRRESAFDREDPSAPERFEEAPVREERPLREDRPARESAPKAKKKESLFFRKETRKKTSEMTEEEKKAHLADREARAAERKRLRDQAAREAGLAGAAEDTVGETMAPVFDAQADGETIGVTETPVGTPVSAEGPVITNEEPAPEMADIPVFTPAQNEAPAGESSWDIAPDLTDGPQVEVETPAAEPVPVEEPAPGKKAPAPEGDLDALLSEIRDMLADSPVPRLAPDQLTRPVVTAQVDETVRTQGGAHLAAEDAADLTQEAQPVEQPQAPVVDTEPAAPAVEPVVEVEAPSAPVAEPAAEVQAEPVEAPTIVIPTAEVEAAVEAAQPQQDVEPESLTAVPAPPADEDEEEEEQPKPRKEKTKKGDKKPLGLILSLVVVIAAVFIIVTQVLPAFQGGLLGGGESQEEQQQEETVVDENAAESLYLNQVDLMTSIKGKTAQLEATLLPEGSTGAVTWASEDPNVASVDANGLVTALNPGVTNITATLPNGVSATCIFRCTWTDDTPQPGEDILLSSTSISLDQEGKTKQITVTGNEGAVKWSSSDTAVVTVSEDGTVTAVAKGGATITAEVDGETFTCEVKCIW